MKNFGAEEGLGDASDGDKELELGNEEEKEEEEKKEEEEEL